MKVNIFFVEHLWKCTTETVCCYFGAQAYGKYYMLYTLRRTHYMFVFINIQLVMYWEHHDLVHD
jgi:hypothetical protein